MVEEEDASEEFSIICNEKGHLAMFCEYPVRCPICTRYYIDCEMAYPYGHHRKMKLGRPDSSEGTSETDCDVKPGAMFCRKCKGADQYGSSCKKHRRKRNEEELKEGITERR